MRLDLLDAEHGHDEDGILWVRTHYGWRMTGRPDPKQGRRIVDPHALRAARLTGEQCAACHRPPANVHHVIQKGSPHFGDDVKGNLLLLCGSGTMGCHGAWHGSPYVVRVMPDFRSTTQFAPFDERRDAEWVARRIGQTINLVRRDVIIYVFWKLGVDAGTEFLSRHYYLEVFPA